MRREWRYIMIHHSLTKDSQTVSWPAIRKYHTVDMGWKDIGYHFGIELVNDQYEILVGRDLNEVGAHCKEGDMNHLAIGVCFVGNFDGEPVPMAQWNRGVKFIRGLCDQFSILWERVIPHRQYATYKSCPGDKFDMSRLGQAIQNG